MRPRSPGWNARSALAISLELSHGAPGASARVEFHDGPDGTRASVALLGVLDAVAVERLAAILEDLARRGIARVTLDAARLRHVEYRQVAPLAAALERIEARGAAAGWTGLSPHLRDLFRLAGCAPAPATAIPEAEPVARSAGPGHREWAS